MARTGVLLAVSDLVGRDRECAVIDDFVERAVGGEGRALVIRGEPGIGKTALLEYAAERPDPVMVLRATGVKAESDLAFAGLYGLIRPIVDKAGELPPVQGAALAGALGLAPATDADRLLVSAAVLGLLAAAAEDQPLVCLVDDAQWLDRPSAEALVFAARRLRAERVAVLFAAREGEEHRFEATGLSELWVEAWTPIQPARSYLGVQLMRRRSSASGWWRKPRAIRSRCSNCPPRFPTSSWPERGRCRR
jgi:hypothetical protein